jgi:hypothetical protein
MDGWLLILIALMGVSGIAVFKKKRYALYAEHVVAVMFLTGVFGWQAFRAHPPTTPGEWCWFVGSCIALFVLIFWPFISKLIEPLEKVWVGVMLGLIILAFGMWEVMNGVNSGRVGLGYAAILIGFAFVAVPIINHHSAHQKEDR